MVNDIKSKAIISEKDGKNEVRCGYCGRLLFIFEYKLKKTVNKSTKNNNNICKIEKKCTRCNSVNEIFL